MAHKHIHKVGDKETRQAIIDPGNMLKHWHMLEGARTSTENFGEGHTHTINGEITGGPIEIEEWGVMLDNVIEFKFNSGEITKHLEQKQDEQFDDHLGIVQGYIATFDLDRGDFFGTRDQFTPGAFLKSIADHLQRNRSIRLLSHHRQIIGQFPINTIREDERGLFGEAQINLKVQEGAEIYALVKQGAISDFSIGFSINEFTEDNDVRTINQATIWEGSLVSEPMNPFANVTDIKSKAVVPFQDLPLADRDRVWDSSTALKRVRELTGSEDEPAPRYKRAFVWYDKENGDVFSGYKLPIADVIDGKLVAIPRGIFAAAGAVQGARGGVQLPESDRPAVIRHLERYYAKMDLDSPFEDERQFIILEDVKDISVRDVEKILHGSGNFSKSAAKYLAGRISPKLDKPIPPVDNRLEDVLATIKAIKLR